MSADRELLELAAKAAGLDVEFWPITGANIVSGPCAGLWRPLEDDGDGARLEAALKLDVQWAMGSVGVLDAANVGIKTECVEWFSQHNSDKQAARRRASVRAAAEIGRTL